MYDFNALCMQFASLGLAKDLARSRCIGGLLRGKSCFNGVTIIFIVCTFRCIGGLLETLLPCEPELLFCCDLELL